MAGRGGVGSEGVDVNETPPVRPPAPTYQGSRFPWWLTLLWVAFIAFGVVYSLIYFLPDLKSWLQK
jgi:hypothetical protein